MNHCELLLQFTSSQPVEQIELDRLARRFNVELQQEDFASELAHASSTEGAKSGIGAEIGVLAVKIAPTFLPILIDRIRKFLARSPDKTIKVKLKMGENTVDLEYPGDKPLSPEQASALIKSLTNSVST